MKTRLLDALGAEGTALLARAMLADSSAAAIRAGRQCDATPALFFDPPGARSAIEAIVGGKFRLFAQSEGDLGVRLANAYRALAVQGYSTVCFVGADSPTLPLHYVASAFDALAAGAHVAIGPAEDGGYYLIALAGAHLGVFEGIAWSTPQVYAQTRARAVSLGLEVGTLPAWYDVDDLATLQRLRRELETCIGPGAGAFAPATRRALALLAT